MVRALVAGMIAVAALSMPVATADAWRIALEDAKGLTPHGVKTMPATHHGKRALQVVEASTSPAEAYALVAGPVLKDGRIEVDLAAQPMASAAADARGFVGVAFRMKGDQSAFECFYLRPTNGRADDQLRRNHSTQYVSFPGFPWERLRRESPGVYE